MSRTSALRASPAWAEPCASSGVDVSLSDEMDAARALSLRGRWRIARRCAARCASRSRSRAPAWDASTGCSRRLGRSRRPPPGRAAAPPARLPRAAPRPRFPRWDAETRPHRGRAGDGREGEQPGYSPEALLRREAAPTARATGAGGHGAPAGPAGAAPGRPAQPAPGPDARPRPARRSAPQLRRALRTEGELVSLARRTRARGGAAPRLPAGHQRLHGPPRPLPAGVRPVASTRRGPRAEVFAFNTELVARSRGRLAPGRIAPHPGAPGGRRCRTGRGGTRIGECLADVRRGTTWPRRWTAGPWS